MSVGTSDTTVISSTKTEARNLNAIDASAAQRDDSSPGTMPSYYPKKPSHTYLSVSHMRKSDLSLYDSWPLRGKNGLLHPY